MIDLFDSHYEFLSNFYMSRFDFDGTSYSSAEHAFQAAKTLDESEKFLIEDQPTPGKAKRMGRKATLRSDWEEVKVGIMEQIVRAKFSQIPERAMLLATGDEELVEGNWWHDVFWGVCNGVGQNKLGKILMKVRSEL